MEVTEDHDIHLNHNCGEVCACSTCHIYVEQGNKHLQEISDREEDFIDRAIDPRIESRLGCQCVVLNEEAEFEWSIINPDVEEGVDPIVTPGAGLFELKISASEIVHPFSDIKIKVS